jgi:SAM-dependent methyltransferase
MEKSNFENEYFSKIYGGGYIKRNPPHKWRTFLREILKHRQQGFLLDIGCALGLFLQEAQFYFECSGCDVSSYALELAREKLPSKISLFQGYLGEITQNNHYDVITCFDVIEHISDLDKVWINLNYLLKPKGILVITVPVYDGPLGWLVNKLDHDPTHVYRASRYFWMYEVNRHFKVSRKTGIWRYFLANRFYLNFLSLRSWRWSPAIMIVAEKKNEV